MKRNSIIAIMLLLALAGVADSWYLYQSAVGHTALACDLGAGLDGCNIVAQSPYSNLFGVPLALYGIGFFALIFVIALALTALESRILYKALRLVTVIGALASVAFLFIQFAIIKAVCVYCIGSAAIAFLLWALALSFTKRYAYRGVATTPNLDAS